MSKTQPGATLHVIQGPAQSGKTTLVTAMLRGLAYAGIPVLYVLPTQMHAHDFKKRNPGSDIIAWGGKLTKSLVPGTVRVIVIDDCDRAPDAYGEQDIQDILDVLSLQWGPTQLVLVKTEVPNV